MSNARSNTPLDDTVATFLSCSIRRKDFQLVQALDQKVLRLMGFRCLTVGRNVSKPDQADDVIKSVLRSVHCLIGVATARFEAVDCGFPERTLVLATHYLLQEGSMAFQADMPFLIFKTPEVTLQGVTGRNLFIEIDNKLHNGKVKFLCSKDLVVSSLNDLRERAKDRRKNQSRNEVISGIVKISALISAGVTVKKVWDWLSRPNCFGDFYYRDPMCQACKFKVDCKVEKTRRQG